MEVVDPEQSLRRMHNQDGCYEYRNGISETVEFEHLRPGDYLKFSTDDGVVYLAQATSQPGVFRVSDANRKGGPSVVATVTRIGIETEPPPRGSAGSEHTWKNSAMALVMAFRHRFGRHAKNDSPRQIEEEESLPQGIEPGSRMRIVATVGEARVRDTNPVVSVSIVSPLDIETQTVEGLLQGEEIEEIWHTQKLDVRDRVTWVTKKKALFIATMVDPENCVFSLEQPYGPVRFDPEFYTSKYVRITGFQKGEGVPIQPLGEDRVQWSKEGGAIQSDFDDVMRLVVVSKVDRKKLGPPERELRYRQSKREERS